MITMHNLMMMNNDWDSADTLFEIHAYEDWNGTKVLYHGTYRDMPTKFEDAKVRAFGTVRPHIYIELEPGEEKNLK